MKVFLDYDFNRFPLSIFKDANETRDLVMIEVQMLKQMFGLGMVKMRDTDAGINVEFHRDVTEEEMNIILAKSMYADKGYKWWVQQRGGKAALRISDKTIVKMQGTKRLGIKRGGKKPWSERILL